MHLLGTLSCAECKAQKIITLLSLTDVACRYIGLTTSRLVWSQKQSGPGHAHIWVKTLTPQKKASTSGATLFFRRRLKSKFSPWNWRDIYPSKASITTQTGTKAGHRRSSFMGTSTMKGQGFDLMSKQNASYSLCNAIRLTQQFCWETINLMLWKQNTQARSFHYTWSLWPWFILEFKPW